MKNEQVFEKEQSRHKSMLDFTRRLVAGDTNAQFISVDENDQLGSSLVELRDNLKKNVEENIRRKKEDDQRS